MCQWEKMRLGWASMGLGLDWARSLHYILLGRDTCVQKRGCFIVKEPYTSKCSTGSI